MSQFVLITGCSGGGKTTLLQELSARGYVTVDEPGRRIVAEERAGSGRALPWVDAVAFARRAVRMARSDLSAHCQQPGPVFFDRGLIDAAVTLSHASAMLYRDILGEHRPYFKTVFLAPPWPEIFAQDSDRRHDLSAAKAEYHRLATALAEMGYEVSLLPRAPVDHRADFVIETLRL